MRLLSLSEVSIQKRTSPDKFTGKLGIRDFEISFAFSLVLAFELTGQSTLQLEQTDVVQDLARVAGKNE